VLNRTTDNHMVVTFTHDATAKVIAGKTRTSDAAKSRLEDQGFRFLPQRLILQGGTGRLSQ
jgi:hypothetical protein